MELELFLKLNNSTILVQNNFEQLLISSVLLYFSTTTIMVKIHLFIVIFFIAISSITAQEKKILKDYYHSATTVDEKELAFLTSLADSLSNFTAPSSMGLLEIPVKIHIIRNSKDLSTLSIEQVQKAFDDLNKHFINIYIRFCPLGDYNYIDNDKLYIVEKNKEDAALNSFDVSNVINLYIVESIKDGTTKFCGLTHYPSGFDKNIDRVFISKDCLNDGVSLTRQLGHYFTLFPTAGILTSETKEWVDQGNCKIEGDRICDTPADPGLELATVNERCEYIGKKQDQSGKRRFYKPNTNNLMADNPRLYCCNEFSEEQYKRMLFAAIHIRKYLSFPKSLYSKKQLKVLAEEKGLQGEVAVYILGEALPTTLNNNLYLYEGRPYPPGTAYRMELNFNNKGYIYILEGDDERGAALLYPLGSDKVFFKGDEPAKFLVPSNDLMLKVDSQKGEKGKNNIIVLFSKKQLQIEKYIKEMNTLEGKLDVVQRMYSIFGTELIPSQRLTYDKTVMKVAGIASDQQIMPIIIEYSQL